MVRRTMPATLVPLAAPIVAVGLALALAACSGGRPAWTFEPAGANIVPAAAFEAAPTERAVAAVDRLPNRSRPPSRHSAASRPRAPRLTTRRPPRPGRPNRPRRRWRRLARCRRRPRHRERPDRGLPLHPAIDRDPCRRHRRVDEPGRRRAHDPVRRLGEPRPRSGGHVRQTFASAGRFAYICGIHESMTGVVVVLAAAPAASPSSAPPTHGGGDDREPQRDGDREPQRDADREPQATPTASATADRDADASTADRDGDGDGHGDCIAQRVTGRRR